MQSISGSYLSSGFQAETKLYYLQARYYDPATARFISRNPDLGDEDESTCTYCSSTEKLAADHVTQVKGQKILKLNRDLRNKTY